MHPRTSFSGVVILDTSCYESLTDSATRERLLSSLRAVDLRIWPSLINAVQARAHPSETKRTRLLEAIHHLAGTLPLLPLPEAIVHESAKAVVGGETDMTISPSLDQAFLSPSGPLPDGLDGLTEALKDFDSLQDGVFDRMRPEVRQVVKASGKTIPWQTLASFLDDQWMTEGQMDEILKAESARIGLSRVLTLDEVTATPSLRLHFEGFGAAMFQRVIEPNQAKRVQASDLMQLIYLGARPKRILVTEDRQFGALAAAVLPGRYPTARVMDWPSFAAANGL